MDLALAVLVTLVALDSLGGHLSVALDPDETVVQHARPDVVGVALLVVSSAPILWRRIFPEVVLLLTGGAFFASHQLGYVTPPIPYGPVIALYTVALVWRPLASLLALAALLLAVTVPFATGHTAAADDALLAHALSLLAGWGIGYGVQMSRAMTDLAQQHAAQVVREQDTRARLAVQKERAHIARQLHDVVSHNVSLIVAHATAAQTIRDVDRHRLLAALASIEATGREAMVQMRRMLRVLQPDSQGDEQDAQPGLDQVPGLVESMRTAGLDVTLVVRGEPSTPDAVVDTIAYRIIDEALTNTLKHAGRAQVEVVVAREEDALTLLVRDDGPGGHDQSAGGHGLVAILQRVIPLGGHLAVGRRPEGGFEVTARLPMSQGAA